MLDLAYQLINNNNTKKFNITTNKPAMKRYCEKTVSSDGTKLVLIEDDNQTPPAINQY